MKNIFKKSSAILIMILFVFVLSGQTFATTASLDSTRVAVEAGQNFMVNIYVNPDRVNFAEKIDLSFPPELLQVKSFTLAGTWIGLIQPDYDIIDNVNGRLIKTAGYPSGLANSALFGTIVFSAKKSGQAKIALNSGSMAFEANTQSVISSQGLVLSINPKTVKSAGITPESSVSKPTTNIVASSSLQGDKGIKANAIESVDRQSLGITTVSVVSIVFSLLAIAVSLFIYWKVVLRKK